MKRTLTAIGAWFRRVYDVLKRMEEAVDYKYEDYAQERFKKLEQRLASLENKLRK
ncbi:MAG TPA: hypothetical protein VGT99_11900 [Gammaproteobacteria bacterium]|nr:hypothetical protein [Gammaproteobacteria bacterium]